MAEQPLIFKQTADEVAAYVRAELVETGWSAAPAAGVPRPGEAMVRIFGRLSELLIQRLNRLPEKHFLAFLNEAGVEPLPPRPASAEVVFTPAKDAASVTRVSAGTQVATKKTADRPEIVFETERDLNVVKGVLTSCLAVDPVKLSDRSNIAVGASGGSFAAFAGEVERERILYLSDDVLFAFEDDASRENAELTLNFTFSRPGCPDYDGWRVEWLCFDGTTWRNLVTAGQGSVVDNTADFSQDGSVVFSKLPLLVPYPFTDKITTAHLACRLTGGTAREHLPEITTLTAARNIVIANAPPRPADLLQCAIHAGSALLPLPTADEFFPFGQGPGRLDAFYLRCDEAFAKEGAVVELNLDLIGLDAGDSGTELTNLRVEWAYAAASGWKVLGTSSRSAVAGTILDFKDETRGFTQGGAGLKIAFTAPSGAEAFDATQVGQEKGLWLRARIIAGGFWADSYFREVRIPVARPPLVKKLTVTYRDYRSASAAPAPPSALHTRVDQVTGLNQPLPLSPFAGDLDLPALYFAFSEIFPVGEWVRLLIEVDEERGAGGAAPLLWWEYWSGDEQDWRPLPVSDESYGLTRRGYLGFYGPEGQAPATFFGTAAVWLRVRPHVRPPTAVAPADLALTVNGEGTATLRLDGSASSAAKGVRVARYHWTLQPPRAAAGGRIDLTVSTPEAAVILDASSSAELSGRELVRYHWRLLSSSHLLAEAGADRVVSTAGDEATLSLDASASADLGGAEPVRCLWRRVAVADEVEAAVPAALAGPYLRSIRLNIVPVINAMTVSEELLGSGNGKEGQSFTLFRPPILDPVALYVRETDRPASDELLALERELASADGDETPDFPTTLPASEGLWVRWRPVAHFYASGPGSRHFDVDWTTGGIRFGDGRRGRVLPPGRDNLKALRYRTHQGELGNVAGAEITVLRNPTGTLAAIKKVANPWSASGGSAAEAVTEVGRRGPRALKHRGRAVTLEDYAWLARDASGEVARAWCLPTRDANGLPSAGWVTLVIVPAGAEDKPFPSPALLRHVRRYLEGRALVNLPAAGQLHIKGPEYVQASVTARIVPTSPDQADEAKLAVIANLRAFLHPLTGGPRGEGWELGRDVHLSEIQAVIEGTAGVEHVVAASLGSSLMQWHLTLAAPLPESVPDGARVATFDERLRLTLAHAMTVGPTAATAAGQACTEEHERLLPVCGFKVGDRVDVVDADQRVWVRGLLIGALTVEGTSVLFEQGFAEDETLPPADELALLARDGSIRLPLVAWTLEAGRVLGASLQLFQPGVDLICIVAEGHRSPNLELLAFTELTVRRDGVAVPRGHLAHSGSHDIEMVLEE